jgi:hypothetical protein
MRTAHVLAADAPPVADKLASVSLRLANYEAEEIDLDAVSWGEAVFVIADTWIPGWNAYVDRREADLAQLMTLRLLITPNGT